MLPRRLAAALAQPARRRRARRRRARRRRRAVAAAGAAALLSANAGGALAELRGLSSGASRRSWLSRQDRDAKTASARLVRYCAILSEAERAASDSRVRGTTALHSASFTRAAVRFCDDVLGRRRAQLHPAQRVNFDFAWRHHLGDLPPAALQPTYNDSSWALIDDRDDMLITGEIKANDPTVSFSRAASATTASTSAAGRMGGRTVVWLYVEGAFTRPAST